MYYLHPNPQSLESVIVKLILRVTNRKKGLERQARKGDFSDSDCPEPPVMITKDLTVETAVADGRKVFTIRKPGSTSEKSILFLHGGAYVQNISARHWELVGQLIRLTGCTFIVPDYPLAPENTYVDAFNMVEPHLMRLYSHCDPLNVIFMGDSAGGGFALALAQKMKMEKVALPGQLILISPWLDFTLQNPEISAVESKDLILEMKGLLQASRSYAGDTIGSHYQLSPINGPLEGLPRISLLTGTHDILYPDCLLLKNRLQETGTDMNFYEFPKMIHDWPLISFLPEAKAAIRILSNLITSNPTA